MIVGIFVGGLGRRMGGRAKGMLMAPEGVPIVERSIHACGQAFGANSVVLVGRHSAYDHLGRPQLEDEPVGIGPMGGLRALLKQADGQRVLALACDMPFITRELLERLSTTSPAAPALAPRPAGHWQPLCARYTPNVVLPVVDELIASGKHGLFRILEQVEAEELVLSEAEDQLLRDWDTPEDIARDR